MTPEEIKDRKTLERWLQTRPPEDSLGIANRAALRVAPLWFDYHPSLAFRQNGHSGEAASLEVLRLLLTSAAARINPISQVVVAIATAKAAVSAAIARPAEPSEASAAYAAGFAIAFYAGVAVSVARGDGDHETEAAGCAMYADDATTSSRKPSHLFDPAIFDSAIFDTKPRKPYVDLIWEQTRTDCRALVSDVNLATVALWQGTKNPFQSQWDQTRARWKTPGSPYAFWLRWYQSALDGKPLDPYLLHDIALIPDKHWQKRETHIAGLIEIIEERHRLLQQIADLKEKLRTAQSATSTAQATELQRSHNHPPELVDAPAVVRQQTTIIWAALDGAEAELKKPDPQPSTLRRIGHALFEASKALVLYFASLGDIVLKKAAEEIGSTGTKWALRIGAACLLGQSIGQALIDLAGKIVAGG